MMKIKSLVVILGILLIVQSSTCCFGNNYPKTAFYHKSSAIDAAGLFRLNNEPLSEIGRVQGADKTYTLVRVGDIIIPVGEDLAIPGKQKIYNIILAYELRDRIPPNIKEDTRKIHDISNKLATIAEEIDSKVRPAAQFLEDNQNNLIIRGIVEVIVSILGLTYEEVLDIMQGIISLTSFIINNVEPIALYSDSLLKHYEEISASKEFLEIPSTQFIDDCKNLGKSLIDLADQLEGKYEQYVGGAIPLFEKLKDIKIEVISEAADYILQIDSKVRGYIGSIREMGQKYLNIYSETTSTAQKLTIKTVKRLEDIVQEYIEEATEITNSWKETVRYIVSNYKYENYQAVNSIISNAENMIQQASKYKGNDYFRAADAAKNAKELIEGSIRAEFATVSNLIYEDLKAFEQELAGCKETCAELLNLTTINDELEKANSLYSKMINLLQEGNYLESLKYMTEVIHGMNKAKKALRDSMQELISNIGNEITDLESKILDAKKTWLIDLSEAERLLNDVKSDYQKMRKLVNQGRYFDALKIVKQTDRKIGKVKELVNNASATANMMYIVIVILIVTAVLISVLLIIRRRRRIRPEHIMWEESGIEWGEEEVEWT